MRSVSIVKKKSMRVRISLSLPYPLLPAHCFVELSELGAARQGWPPLPAAQEARCSALIGARLGHRVLARAWRQKN